MKLRAFILSLFLFSLVQAAPDLGTSLSVQATRQFNGLWVAGYQQQAVARSPVMMNSDGYLRIMLGADSPPGCYEAYFSPQRKDFQFIGPRGATNRNSRAPLLYTLDPLTLREVLISPAPICNASAGNSSTQGAYWGNAIPIGMYNVIELGDDVIASYGGDINDVVRFHKFSGAVAPANVAHGSNWSGLLQLQPDGSLKNLDTSAYPSVRPFVTTATTDRATYAVAATTTGYRITRTEAGKAGVYTIVIGANPGQVCDVRTANGLLAIESFDSQPGGKSVTIAVIRGDKTPTLVLPMLPRVGYVKATPVLDKTTPMPATARSIKPVLVGYVSKEESGGNRPKTMTPVRFAAVPAGSRVFVRATALRKDGIDATYRLTACANTVLDNKAKKQVPWTLAMLRYVDPAPVGASLGDFPVTKLRSGYVLLEWEIPPGVYSTTGDWCVSLNGTDLKYINTVKASYDMDSISLVLVPEGDLPPAEVPPVQPPVITPPPPVTPPPLPPQTSWKFDFGTGVVQQGFTRVLPTQIYSPGGYGFMSAVKAVRNVAYAPKFTFKADVPDGRYSVTLTLGDEGPYQHDKMAIGIIGVTDTISTAAKQVITRTYEVTVAGGTFALTEAKLPGAVDPNCVLISLTLEQIGGGN